MLLTKLNRGTIPPAISLAMYVLAVNAPLQIVVLISPRYRADAVAETYTTLGYLIAIISILGFCIMPRAKFIQTMIMDVIGVCLGAAVNLLMLWSALQARLHTTPPGRPPDPYNSSQSAVCAIWLFFQIWLANTVKAKFPQLAFPVIMYSIFVNVASSYGPRFRTTVQCTIFIRNLLISFLTGLGIATGVSLLVFPVTCRNIVTKEITGYIMLLKGISQAHKNWFQSLETSDIFSQDTPSNADGKSTPKTSTKKPEVEALRKLTSALTALHGKLYADLPFAKREVAWGKLTPSEFEGIYKRLRAIMLPIVGLESLIDLFSRSAELNHWNQDDPKYAGAESDKLREQSIRDWNEIMKSIHEPVATIVEAMDGGLQHVLLKLQLIKNPKKKSPGGIDPEAKGDVVQAGDNDFASYLEKQCEIFGHGKDTTLQHWVESKGIKVPENFFEHSDPLPHFQFDDVDRELHMPHHRNRRQLYVVLYIIFLLNSVSRAVLELVKFADEINLENRKSKLITPGKRRLEKWVASIFTNQDHNHDNETTAVGIERSNIIYMGEAYKMKKDPEHLPPANGWEKFGNILRAIPRFLRSPQSAFGFRTACATMSIAIIVFLRDTQAWFIRQRIVWASIMVAISMVPTSGATVYQFLLRICGTILAMIVAFMCWYIPDQKTAGVIVLLWFFTSFGFYFPLKHPELVIAALIGIVTTTLIIGYELEVQKIGRELATSNGQPYYPIYQLAPYRLAAVVGGLAVAFFWTIFPFPVSEHSALRQKLGQALYLSANSYSIMHETVMARIRGDEGDAADPQSPAFQLTKARNKVFAKQMMTLQGLKLHAEMVKWEFPLGGKFPRKEYEAIIQYVTK